MAGGLSSRVLNMKFMRNALTKEQKSKLPSSETYEQNRSSTLTSKNKSEINGESKPLMKDTYSSIQEQKYRWSIDGVKSSDLLKKKNKKINKFHSVGYSGMKEFFEDSTDDEHIDLSDNEKLVGRKVFGKDLKEKDQTSEDEEKSSGANDTAEDDDLVQETRIAKTKIKTKKENKKKKEEKPQKIEDTNDADQLISEIFGKAEDYQNKSNVIPSVASFLKGDVQEDKNEKVGKEKRNKKRLNSSIRSEKNNSKKKKKREN